METAVNSCKRVLAPLILLLVIGLLAAQIPTQPSRVPFLLISTRFVTGRWTQLKMDAGSTTDQAEKPESSPYTQKLEDCLLQWNMTVEDFGALNGDLPYPTILQVGRYRDFNYGSISDKVTECKAKVDCNNDTVIVTGYEFTVLFDHTELSQRDQENRRIVSGELTFGRNLLTALHALDVLVVYAHEPSDALFFSRILHPYVKVTFMGSGSTASALDEGNNELLPMEDYSSFPYVRQGKLPVLRKCSFRTLCRLSCGVSNAESKIRLGLILKVCRCSDEASTSTREAKKIFSCGKFNHVQSLDASTTKFIAS